MHLFISKRGFCTTGVFAASVVVLLFSSTVYAELSLQFIKESPLINTRNEQQTALEVTSIESPILVMSTRNVGNSQQSNLNLVQKDLPVLATQNVVFKLVGPLVNYPNPFSYSNGQTSIGYRLTTEAYLTLKIYTLGGQQIYTKEITPADYGAARYNKIPFSRSVLGGESLPPGVYLYVLLHEGKLLAKNRMVVLP